MKSKIQIGMLIAVLILIIAVHQIDASDKTASEIKFSLHIFSSNNLTGNLEPCG